MSAIVEDGDQDLTMPIKSPRNRLLHGPTSPACPPGGSQSNTSLREIPSTPFYSAYPPQLTNRRRCSASVALMTAALLLLTATIGVQSQAIVQIEAVKGQNASLPCEALGSGSVMEMVIWYKNYNTVPFYRVDLDGLHRLDNRQLKGDRAKFLTEETPPELLLEKVVVEDEGIYTCEIIVGLNSYVKKSNLSVSVPPGPPEILDAQGQQVNLSQLSYNEGDSIDLICQVKGGRPRPQVTWYGDNEQLNVVKDDDGSIVIRNRLTYGPLTRDHANVKLTCLVTADKLATPLSTYFWLKINYKPSSASIVTEDQPLKVGEKVHLQCQSRGATPPADITWWLDGRQITEGVISQVTEGGNMTLSTLELIPVIQYKDKVLECKASSPVIQHAPVVDRRVLNVHYMGSVSLEMIGIDPHEGVVEGERVSMRCSVDSDPPPRYIHWFVKKGNMTEKITEALGEDFVIDQVRKNHSAVYSCVASNGVGDGHSNAHMLQVNYIPTCETPGIQMIGIGTHEEARLGCKIDSSPDPVSYRWQRNSTGSLVDISQSMVKVLDNISILRHTPKSDNDYGTFYCYASNSIGEQEIPCKFELVSAVYPAPLTNCTASKNDTNTVYISCDSESENSLPLTFVAEIFDVTRDRLLRNITNNEPYFILKEMDPGSGFKIDIYSSNLRGPSEKYTLLAFTQPLVKKSMGILVGIVGAVVVMAIIVVVVMKMRSTKAHKNKLKCTEQPMLVPATDQDYKYGGGGPGKGNQTIINFPSEPLPPPPPTPEKTKPSSQESPKDTAPSAPPEPEVEYAELEFSNGGAKAKKKKKKSKKKKEMKDEETEYASIDHVRTMLQNQQQRDQTSEAKDDKEQPLGEAEAVMQPLIKVESPGERTCAPVDIPEGALESSV